VNPVLREPLIGRARRNLAAFVSTEPSTVFRSDLSLKLQSWYSWQCVASTSATTKMASSAYSKIKIIHIQQDIPQETSTHEFQPSIAEKKLGILLI